MNVHGFIAYHQMPISFFNVDQYGIVSSFGTSYSKDYCNERCSSTLSLPLLLCIILLCIT